MSRSVVPNLFTVLNIFFGFLAVIQAVQNQFTLAISYIFFAAICDTLDGFMARLTKSASEFGVELDSLADVVSFGVAPSFLLYQLFLHQYGPIGTLVSAMPLIFGALRLARFNVQLVGYTKNYFNGLPIPLASLTLISNILFFTPKQIMENVQLQYFCIALIAAISLLMVSMIRYPVLPKFSRKSFRAHPFQMSLYLAAAILVAVTGLKALFPILLTVVLSGVTFAALRVLNQIIHPPEESNNEEHGEPQPSPVKHRR